MGNPDRPNVTRELAGLCADCVHARSVESTRGSIFLLCQLSRRDPRFAKYPRLPIVSCSGYKENPEHADTT